MANHPVGWRAEAVACPFCGEDDFDLIGLKGHLLNDGECVAFEECEMPRRWFDIPKEPRDAE